MSLREKILECKDIQSELLEVPQWGVTVEVRGMTGRQRAILLQNTMDKKGNMILQKLYPSLVIATSFDPETGEKIFMDGDFDAVSEKSGGALETIAQVAMKLSGLNPEEVEKNSEVIPSEDSISI